MPRTAWVAIGAIGAALMATALPAAISVSPAAAAAAALGLAAVALGASLVGRTMPLACLAVGAGLIALRALLGVAAAPVSDLPTAQTADRATAHEAVVLSVSTPQDGQQRAVLELRPPEPAFRVYAWLPRYPPVAPTDIVAFDGRLEQAPTDAGFGEFLAGSGITFTDRPTTLSVIGGDASPLAALEQLRRAAAADISAALPEPQAGLAAAMAIGLRDLVSSDVSADFRTAGMSHIVAISGWHICLLAGVIGGLLKPLSRRRRSLLVLLAVVGYAILAGASPSVVRAAVMASVALIARESGRRGSAPAALSLTVAAMLLVEPATIGDVGFQLSAAATAGLLVWAGPFKRWLADRLPQRVPGWLLEALAVSLSAQAATLPLVLLTFGRLSLISPLANVLVAPIVAPVMMLVAVSFACGLAIVGFGAPALLFAPITLIASIGIGLMIAIAHAAASVPLASVTLAPPLDLAGAGGAAAALAAVAWRTRRGRAAGALPAVTLPKQGAQSDRRTRFTPTRVAFGASLGGLCLLLAIVNGARPDGRLRIDVLDIGQGDAILLEGPDGGRMLVDTGPDPDRLITLLDQRLPPWDRRIDLVVITHPHEDHIGGLALLLERYHVGEVAESGHGRTGTWLCGVAPRAGRPGHAHSNAGGRRSAMARRRSPRRRLAAARRRATSPGQRRQGHQQRIDRA